MKFQLDKANPEHSAKDGNFNERHESSFKCPKLHSSEAIKTQSKYILKTSFRVSHEIAELKKTHISLAKLLQSIVL